MSCLVDLRFNPGSIFLGGVQIWRALMKPSKKVFDLVLIVSLLVHPAVGLVKMSARRWSREGSGTLATVGDGILVAL